MKKIVTLLLISIPLLATAQAKSNVSPYAKGAVNTVNGMVVFEKSIEDKSHSQAQLFQTMKDFLGTLVVMSENEDRSKVTKEDSGNGILEAQVEEMLYFKRKPWETDATYFIYTIQIGCSAGNVKLKISQIRYIYDEDRFATNALMTAEETITDEHAFKANGKTLRKEEGKFRKATIDRVNEIFNNAEQYVKN